MVPTDRDQAMQAASTTPRSFELPDALTALPLTTFEFTPAAAGEARAALAGPPAAVFQRLVRDQESEAVHLLALCIVDGFLARAAAGAIEAASPAASALRGDLDAGEIARVVLDRRDALARAVDALGGSGPEIRDLVWRQRAPLGLVAGCWLDTLSQPATQPSVIVNRLFAHHYLWLGEGNPQRSVHHLRRRALEAAGVFLPDIDAEDFPRQAQARPLTMWHAAFYVALSRLPASFLPEVVGVHVAVNGLGVDDRLLGTEAPLGGEALRDVLAEYLALTGGAPSGEACRRRLRGAVALALALESEHVTMLAQLVERQRGLSLDSRVAAIVERHAPFAGSQHRGARVGERLLSRTFRDPAFDVAGFLRDLRRSSHFKPRRGGEPRFLRAIKFGGPMFGLFDEREAAVWRAWSEAIHTGELPPDVELSPERTGDDAAQAWGDAVVGREPAVCRSAESGPLGERDLFYRLVHIEHFAAARPIAMRRAGEQLAAGEILFAHGAGGRYTDASWFDYGPEALLDRVHRIYWDKLIEPYRSLERVPDRETVIFGQKTFALGSLIDGAWAHRIGNLGRFQRRSDAALFAIYADEMGRGDLQKNHITLIHRVLRSMSIELPHIRDRAFLEQAELPDTVYRFCIHQLCLALFPDSFYPEILGYNLGIEMFGLGELRLHEMQKLRHHGFDAAYEQTHLSIDNVSAGHARQSADLIISYLDDVRRTVGRPAVSDEWRRVWRGYASFAYFVEHELVERLARRAEADLVI